MEDSGFFGESKIRILDSIPDAYKPRTLFIASGSSFDQACAQFRLSGIDFPCIVKPDIGGRGRKVEIIADENGLKTYHEGVGEDYLIQQLIPYDIELGVFYIRMVNEEKGCVVSVAEKGFLQVTGNDVSSIRQLMKNDYRASLQVARLGKQLDLDQVPKAGERILLEPIGNHCRGTSFIDRHDLINEKLNKVFDVIAAQIPGFYYGRFDLRVKSLDDLYEGKNILIMELNGLTSDAAHIFDPLSRLRDAYATQIRHCHLSYAIAKQNLKAGVKPTPLFELISKTWKSFRTE
jgi:hypothetical protein